MKKPNLSVLSPLLLATSLVLVSACSSSDDDNDAPNNDTSTEEPGQGDITSDNTGSGTNEEETTDVNTPPPLDDSGTISYAYAFTRAPNYSSANIERISITDGNVVDGSYPAGASDHALDSDGKGLYQIGRSKIDSITKFDPVDTSVVEYQISVKNGRTDTTNPQALAILDENLAYLTRRAMDSLLIIDPTPEQLTPESLINGEISLSAYTRGSAESPDFPDMTDAVIVDNKLFVLLEFLDGFSPVTPGYIAVIDLATNLEIETGQGVLPLKGIQLNTLNPSSLHYNEDTGLLYVTGRGDYYGSPSEDSNRYTGGVEAIDPITYQTNLLVDDGTESENNGFFNQAIVVSNTLGYVITLEGFDASGTAINNLRSFNPSTGILSAPVAGTEGLSLTLLALAPDDHLWVGIQADAPGFMRINLETGELVAEEIIATNQIPADIVFIEVDRQ